MKTLLVVAACLAVASAQYTIQSLDIKPSTERGYIEITLTRPGVNPMVGPVCGEIEFNTALVVCQENGWLTSVGYDTAGDYQLTVPNPPVARNLICTGFSNVGGTSAFFCTVQDVGLNGTSCGSTEVAAVSCYFTVGQIVGIAIGGFLLCVLITALPFILCCICCCCGVCCAANA